ncbi:unnamed protein product [Penicillium salamii]|uniref:SCP domain-containing protein n=1 Tax=Penicillium salamii TaxID=1612424 RepID=A0A9W4N8U2_9EURO|nr:unnamed protein product [Penicillium salamii]CAG8327029.1 unnamed protein product [Penicillium salamii]CAG8394788.1 unnamed protein product [Penicillium salamii]
MGFKNLTLQGWLAIYILLTASMANAKELSTMTIGAPGQPTVVITVEAPPVPTTPQDPSYLDPEILKKDTLDVTNDYRTQHSAKPLVWNDTLAEYSKKWAEACIWKHSNFPSYGENIAYGFTNVTGAIKAFGDERDLYNFTLPTGFTHETGHFTQLVWQGSRQMGCAAFDCGYTREKSKTVAGKRNMDPDTSPQVYDEGLAGLTKRENEDGQGEEKRAQGWYLVCEYQPPGNVFGDDNKWFKKNVLPQKKPKTSATSATSTTAANKPTANATTTGAAATPTSGGKSAQMGGAFKAGFGSMMMLVGMMCVEMGL